MAPIGVGIARRHCGRWRLESIDHSSKRKRPANMIYKLTAHIVSGPTADKDPNTRAGPLWSVEWTDHGNFSQSNIRTSELGGYIQKLSNIL